MEGLLMMMHEVTAEMSWGISNRFPYTLDIHVGHAEADNFRWLVKTCEEIQILGLDEVAEDHVRLVVGCTDEATRDRLRNAW
jgi:hypothetical protein